MFFQFPSAYIWHRTLPNHEEIKARVLPKIISEAEQNQSESAYKWSDDCPSTVVTSYRNKDRIFEVFQLEDLQHIALESLGEFIRSGELRNAVFADNYTLKAFWWNRYCEGSIAPPHVHSCGISGVYFLEQTGESPLHFMDVNPHATDSERPSLTFSPQVGEGSVLLFPGTLTHWVAPASGPRTTVSFNLHPELTS